VSNINLVTRFAQGLLAVAVTLLVLLA